jgi:hypothetical protein
VSARRILTGLAAATSLLTVAGCSGDPVAPETPAATSLAGTYRGSMSVAQMTRTARAAGFAPADIREYLTENFGDATTIVYTLKLVDDRWIVFGSVDGGSAEEQWSGPYHVVDGSTVEAGAPPCGPITYGYQLAGDELSIDLQHDECPGPTGEVEPGELIAQTTIYETVPFERVG